jgi:type I restriction enzyme S subunit
MLYAGDVLVVRSGVFAGMSCVVPAEYDRVNCIDVVFATPRREVVASEWLSLFINSAMGQVEIKRGERGLAQKHFGVDAMKNLKIPLPPLEEQQKHLARLNEISKAATSSQTQVNYLRQTTAAIVEQLFET